jgi:hypothetical protein
VPLAAPGGMAQFFGQRAGACGIMVGDRSEREQFAACPTSPSGSGVRGATVKTMRPRTRAESAVSACAMSGLVVDQAVHRHDMVEPAQIGDSMSPE